MRIGQLEVLPLLDAEVTFTTLGEAFSGLPDEYVPQEDWWLPIQALLIRGPDAVVLVDTGLGPAPRAFAPEAESQLLPELERHGVVPEAIGLVVHTHLHVDHVGWDGAFPSARYLVHQDDWEFFMTPESLELRPHLREKVAPLQEAGRIDLIAGEAEVASGIRVISMPGHTPGHIGVRIDSAGESAVFIGDALVHAAQIVDPGIAYASDADPAVAIRTRQRVLARMADEKIPVMASHLPGAGRLARLTEGFTWEPL